MKIKFVLLASAAVFAISTGYAQAETVKKKDWSGVHGGFIGGYGWGKAHVSADIVGMPEDGSTELHGSMLGAVIGYDYQLNNGLVFGILGDYSFGKISGTACLHQSIDTSCGVAPDTTAAVDLNWLSTARARVGYAINDTMLYATGGVAIGGVDVKINEAAIPVFSASTSKNLVGFAFGAGVEYRLTDPMTIGLEYLHVDFGKNNYEWSTSPSASGEVESNLNLIRGSLQLKF